MIRLTQRLNTTKHAVKLALKSATCAQFRSMSVQQ